MSRGRRRPPKAKLARRARADEREAAAFAAGVHVPDEACGHPVCICPHRAGVRVEHPRCPEHGGAGVWQPRTGLVHSE